MQPWDLHVAMLIRYTLPGAHCVGVARGILLLWCVPGVAAASLRSTGTLDLRQNIFADCGNKKKVGFLRFLCRKFQLA